MTSDQEDSLVDALIICTRNRGSELRSCLYVLQQTTDCPDYVLVVDSSDGDESRRVVDHALGLWSGCGKTLQYVHSEPGLTHQRNVGLERLGGAARFVFFIDDDCLVPDGYFSALRGAYQACPGCVGVGGAVRGTSKNRANSPVHSIKSRAYRLLLLGANPGHVTRAGINTRFIDPPDENQRVEWLTGGAMSYRVDAIGETRFDESGLDGYCAGEDLDFSLRMGSKGALVQAQSAFVFHDGADSERATSGEHAYRAIISRYYMIRKYPQRFSRLAFWYSILGELALAAITGDKERQDAVARAATMIRHFSKTDPRPSRVLAI